jgi:hypothetical protein
MLELQIFTVHSSLVPRSNKYYDYDTEYLQYSLRERRRKRKRCLQARVVSLIKSHNFC